MFAIGPALLAVTLSHAAPQQAPDRPPVGEQPNGTSTGPNCHGRAADASARLDDGDEHDDLESGNTAYATRARCDRFVADFIVMPDAHAYGHFAERFDIGGRLATRPDEDCGGARVDVTIYKKQRGATTFASYAHYVLEGEWTPPGDVPFGRCTWNVVEGALAAEAAPNERGREVYRVAVKATMDGAAQPVRAWVAFQPKPA